MPQRIPQSQQDHDREVCRLAAMYRNQPIWSSCPAVPNTVSVPSFPHAGQNHEPDVFLLQVKPQGEQQPVDWTFEIETSEWMGSEHTRSQLSAFVEYSRMKASKVIVLVPPQDVDKMRQNLSQWGLMSVIVTPWGWPQ